MKGKNKREILAAHFDHHAKNEGEVLEEYRNLAKKLEPGPASLLTDLILTDEAQHHFLLRMIAKWLRNPLKDGEMVQLEWIDRNDLLQHIRELRS
ncbi:MAG: hypothetical protein HY695_22690 [Deltaproteobacteria bacterium]|nr:hypothetical protein [Deltaproteobacteria bacterium]